MWMAPVYFNLVYSIKNLTCSVAQLKTNLPISKEQDPSWDANSDSATQIIFNHFYSSIVLKTTRHWSPSLARSVKPKPFRRLVSIQISQQKLQLALPISPPTFRYLCHVCTHFSSLHCVPHFTSIQSSLTLIVLMWRIGWAHNNARK